MTDSLCPLSGTNSMPSAVARSVALPALSAPYRMGRTYRYGKIAVTIYHRDGDGEAEA